MAKANDMFDRMIFRTGQALIVVGMAALVVLMLATLLVTLLQALGAL